jgi:hypothetical protein
MKNVNRPLIQSGVEESNGDVISGLPRPLQTEITSGYELSTQHIQGTMIRLFVDFFKKRKKHFLNNLISF